MKRFLPLLIFVYVLNGQTMAVLEFKGKGISQTDASALSDRLNNELYKLGTYRLVERNQINEILIEQGFQQSGCTSDECVVEVGKLLGAQKMVAGSISKVGDVYSVSARIVDMQSGEIDKFANLDHEGKIGDLLKWGMEDIALQLVTAKMDETTIDSSSIVSVTKEKKGFNKMYLWGGLILLGGGTAYYFLSQKDKTGSVNVSVQIPLAVVECVIQNH